MKTDDKTPSDAEEPGKGQIFLNIGKIIFLVAVLVVAWYVLDWLITKK